MARNGSGTYVLVNTASIATGNTISSTDMMATLNDIATALTQSLAKDGQTTPSANIPMGGNKLTGLGAAASAGDALRYEQLFTTSAITLLGALNQVKGADIASAGTINLTTATGNGVHITGTTAITAVTLGSGMMRMVVFDGVLTLTHHATNNNLPGGINITTAAGDRALYWADGTTTYCLGYFPAAGTQTYDADIATVAASQAEMESGAEVSLRSMSPLRVAQAIASLTPNNSKIVQIVEATPYTTYTAISTAIPIDNTIPQNTEGDEIVTVSITPANASNRLRISAICEMVNAGSNLDCSMALFQDSTANALSAAVKQLGGSGVYSQILLEHEMAAGTTSATTFKIRIGPGSGTIYVNGNASNRIFGGVSAVRLSVTEVKV